MNESDARQVMLVQSLETPPGISQWQEEDRDWASRQAVAQLGEHASSEQFIARRAELAVERLGGRTPLIARLLASVTWRNWILPALLVVAFLVGLLADAISADRQINILAPPLLVLLIWNLVVYLLIAANWLFYRRSRQGADNGKPQARDGTPGRDGGDEATRVTSRAVDGSSGEPRSEARSPPRAKVLAGRLPGPLTRLLARLAGATAGGRHDPNLAPALSRFINDWLHASSMLTTARAHACLHYAAAAFAAGALAGLYARGLAFEFLAGWDSTFLDANGVHRLLQVVLGPASLLTGLPLPDVNHLAGLRFSHSAGENATIWIHLHAVTIGLFVIVPRIVLGATAQWHAAELARQFPLDLEDPYFRHLDRRHRGAATVVQVLPYSFTLVDAGRQALERLLHRTWGENTRMQLAEPVRMGDEEEVGGHWQVDPTGTIVIVLYAATATPEHENHGAILDEVRRLSAGAVPVMAMVDEGAFRQRFAADPQRLASREAAWRKLIESHMDAAPFFVSLDAGTGDATADALETWLDENASRLGQNGMLKTRGNAAPAGTSA